MPRTLALFDIDGTLVAPPSSEVRFTRWLFAHGRLGPRRLLAYVLRLTERLVNAGTMALKTNKAHLAGFDSDELAGLVEEFLDEAGDSPWIPEARARLEAHRERGDEVVLLTGTPDLVAAALARRLGADAWFASILDRKDGRITASPPHQHPHGHVKLDIARRLAIERGVRLEDAWAYGDAWGDRHLLSTVGHPVAVWPCRRLLRLARLKGWECLAAPPGAPRQRPATGDT